MSVGIAKVVACYRGHVDPSSHSLWPQRRGFVVRGLGLFGMRSFLILSDFCHSSGSLRDDVT